MPTYGSNLVAADVVEATVTFSAAVDITGTPQLELDFDGTPKAANCTAAMNTTTIVCAYTVVENDSAPNGIAIAANKLTLNGGTIRATGSTTLDAVLTHAALAINAGHKVDGVRPTLVTTGNDAPQTSVDGTQVIYTFSEDIGSVTLNSFNLEVDNGPNQQAGATATISGRTVTVTLLPVFTIQYGQAVEITLGAGSVRDTAGNENSPIEDQAVTNTIPPPPAVISMVEITSDPGTDQIYATGDDVEVTATFDQAVAVTGKPRIELRMVGGSGSSGRRWAEYASGSGTTALVFSYTVVATDESDTDGIGLGNTASTTNNVDLNGGTITVDATGADASRSDPPFGDASIGEAAGAGRLRLFRWLDDDSPAPAFDHIAARTNRKLALLNKGPKTFGDQLGVPVARPCGCWPGEPLGERPLADIFADGLAKCVQLAEVALR